MDTSIKVACVCESGDLHPEEVFPSWVRCEKAFRNGTFKTKQYPIKIKIKNQKLEREEGEEESRKGADAMDPDSLLMPPPPPRFSKRQRVHSPNVGHHRAAAIATVVDPPPPPLSISIPNRQVRGRRGGQSASPGGVYKAHDGAGEVSDDNGASPVPPAVSSPNGGGGAKLALSGVDFAAKGHEGKENRPDIDHSCCPPRNGKAEGSLRTTDDIEDEDEDDGRRSPDLLVDLEGDANGPPGQVSAASTDNDTLHNEDINGEDEDPATDAEIGEKSGGAPPVSFADIIGHGPVGAGVNFELISNSLTFDSQLPQAKLRLEEALLPLALPPELAATVLTGIRAAPASILLHGPPGECPSPPLRLCWSCIALC